MAVVIDSRQSVTITLSQVHSLHIFCCWPSVPYLSACVISAALGQLTAMLLKNVVSIGYKAGYISGHPLMWPVPKVVLRELLVASPFNISLTKDLCDFLELWSEGGGFM